MIIQVFFAIQLVSCNYDFATATSLKQPTDPEYKEWLDFVSQKSVRGWLGWPGLHMFPRGLKLYDLTRERFEDLELKSESDLAGLWKLTEFSKKCLALTNKNKTLPGKVGWLNCYKMCFMGEMKIIKSHWDQKHPVVVGTVDEVTSVMRSILTDTTNSHGANVSVELVAEAVANIFVTRATRYLQTRPDISCHNDTWDNYFFYDYVVDKLLELQFGVMLRMYKYEIDDIIHSTTDEAASNNTKLKLWPDLSCVERWVSLEDYPKSKLVEANKNLYMHNRDCHELYGIPQFRIEYGGEPAVSSCIKTCILIGLRIANYKDYSEDSHGHQTVYNEKVALETLRIPSLDPIGSGITSALYHFLEDKFPDHDESECYRSDKWNPTFQAVDNFFETKCNQATERPIILEVSYTERPLDTGALWPDFSCIAGWYNKQNWDPNLHLAESRSAGLTLLRGINRVCEEGDGSILERCKKQCILRELGLTKFSEESVGLVNVESFGDALAAILTDSGGFDSVNRMTEEVYPAWNKSEIWKEVSTRQHCEFEHWIKLFEELDGYIAGQSTITKGCSKSQKSIMTDESAKDEYLNSSNVMYTANMDFSCYPEFWPSELRDAGGEAEQGMPPYVDAYNECNDQILKWGIKSECMTSCMLNKMGLFRWVLKGKGELLDAYMPEPREMAISLVSKYFSSSRDSGESVAFFETVFDGVKKECEEIFTREAVSKGCSKMHYFEDCVERLLSCNHTGKFLTNSSDVVPTGRSLATQKTGVEPKNTNKAREEANQIVDMSCRQGFAKTDDFRKGSALLTKISVACATFVEHGYYDCAYLCMLEQMGVLVQNSTEFNGTAYRSTYVFNDEQEMTLRLNQVLMDFGGWDSSYQIASNLVKECSEKLNNVGVADCFSDSWAKVFSCFNLGLECKTFFLFANVEQPVKSNNAKEIFQT